MGEITNWKKEWPATLMSISGYGYVTYKSKVLNTLVEIKINKYFTINGSLSLETLKKDYERMVKEYPEFEAIDADALVAFIYLYKKG